MTPSTPVGPRIAVLVPVKAFHLAKTRLSERLDANQRGELARRMAAGVLAAAAPLPTFVVCDDDVVADWAASFQATVLWRPGRGLDQAVAAGVAALASQGIERVIVAHADLPLARSLAWAASFDGITIVPDRRSDGTNVISLPTNCGFRFAYGPNSYLRHATEAHRLGLALRVVRHAALSWDVDVPEDLAWAADGVEIPALP